MNGQNVFCHKNESLFIQNAGNKINKNKLKYCCSSHIKLVMPYTQKSM